MSDLTKKQRSRLRQLAAECHQHELEEAMEELYEDFQKWGGKGIDVFELNERIHKFHDGISRDLYKLYVLCSPGVSVSVALQKGVLAEEELDDDLAQIFKQD